MKKIALLALFLAIVPLSAAQDLRIVPLVRGGSVLVSFQMTDGFNDEVRAAIRSGLKTTFTYNIELRTGVAAWIDRTIASTVFTTSVQFDNLTRRHTVERSLDGRVQDAHVTDSDEQVRQWATTVERLPLFRSASLEPNREYYVRVRAEIRPRNATFLWPWGSGRSAQAKFTFIP